MRLNSDPAKMSDYALRAAINHAMEQQGQAPITNWVGDAEYLGAIRAERAERLAFEESKATIRIAAMRERQTRLKEVASEPARKPAGPKRAAEAPVEHEHPCRRCKRTPVLYRPHQIIIHDWICVDCRKASAPSAKSASGSREPRRS